MPKPLESSLAHRLCRTLARVAFLPLACALGACGPSLDRGLDDPHERVTRYLDALVDDEREVGFQYVVVSERGVTFEYVGGRADAASGRLVEPATMFLTASTTKVLTAAAVLRLEERGLIDLEAPLSRYVPEHPYGSGVTIRQLLNQSSGVPNPIPVRWVHTVEEHARFDETRALESVLAENPELDFPPGERYAYSNLSYWLLGRVLESVAGRPYCETLRTEVLDPLDIAPSELDCEVRVLESFARGHQAKWSMLGLALPLMTDEAVWDDDAGKWARFRPLYMNGPAYGGVVGTARGYAKFLRDLLQPKSRLLGDEARRRFFSEQRSSSGEVLPTTLGWHRGNLDGIRYHGKPGGGPGFSGNLRIYPAQRVATVFLSNQMRVTEGEIQEVSDVLDGEILPR